MRPTPKFKIMYGTLIVFLFWILDCTILSFPHLLSQFGRTPLGVAAAKGHVNVVRVLLDKKVNVRSIDKVICALLGDVLCVPSWCGLLFFCREDTRLSCKLLRNIRWR